MAASLCDLRGVRFTPLRRRVFELIWGSHVPLGAYAILDRLQETDKHVRPPTVYRALDFLKNQGLIHRIESQNAYLGCVDPSRPHPSQHLICQGCGKVTEIDDRSVATSLVAGAIGKDFELVDAAIEAHGLCRDCRSEGAPASPDTQPKVVFSPPPQQEVQAPTVQVPPVRAPDLKQGPEFLSVRGLTLHRGGLLILDRVDLTVHEGEIVTIIGPNGSGKTSLVRALLGLIDPEAGNIKKADGLRIGYVPQVFAVDPNLPLTVRRFLAMAIKKDAIKKDAIEKGTINKSAGKKKAIEEALADVGAGDVLAYPIQHLSGGELRRVLLARALLRKPDLLVLDEPVQGVDILGQSELYRLINDVRRKQGCAVLMISHDLRLVMAATDEVICLNHHVCCAGHPEAVSRHPEYLALFGEKADETSFAVYTHHHDHVHDEAGNVVPVTGSPVTGSPVAGLPVGSHDGPEAIDHG